MYYLLTLQAVFSALYIMSNKAADLDYNYLSSNEVLFLFIKTFHIYMS